METVALPDGLRELARRTYGIAYHLSPATGFRLRELESAATSWWMRRHRPDLVAAMPSVVAAMVGSGMLLEGEPGLYRARRRPPAEPGLAALASYAGSLARRCLPGAPEAGADALADLFMRLRALCHAFATVSGDLSVEAGEPVEAVLLPGCIAVDATAGARLTGARMLVIPRSGGVRGVWVPPTAMEAAFPEPGKATMRVRLEACGRWRDEEFPPERFMLTPLRFRRLCAGHQELEPSWTLVQRGREAAGAFTGHAVPERAWRRFEGGLRKARRIESTAARLVWQSALPEARAVCQRAPAATLGLYAWYAHRDPAVALRRRQAGEAYPLLAGKLEPFADAIDAGLPLGPAIAERFRLPQPFVRHLRGMAWQSLGKSHHPFLQLLGASILHDVLERTPPERYPVGKAQWAGFLATVDVLHRTLPWPTSAALVRTASADWTRLPRVAARTGIQDAIQQTAMDIDVACSPILEAIAGRRLPSNGWRVRTALVRFVLGEGGGMARLERFAADWHRGESARTIERMRIERAVWGDAPVAWPPLTRAPFSCRSGRMEWVTAVDALLAEGAEMRHCVGSHQGSCLYDRSHVARVFGAKGGRTTVEVRWEIPAPDAKGRPRLSLVEHKATGNDAPPADCEATVAAFLKRGAALVDADVVGTALKARQERLERRRGVPMPGWGRQAILASYDPCLARYGAGLSAGDWADRILACPAKDESSWGGQCPAPFDEAGQGDIPF